ncbi:uncharacterized protein LOC124483621 [Hypomesus transpacificus]|uniref:uncharacterized protein LOC124483621 n=1 Tax=Hypomesus transpacificus TaxID=137520 RepID=UPI001F075BC2|nr:uncharacterized protein LOC124483621 [Hypomesus transpacificus]
MEPSLVWTRLLLLIVHTAPMVEGISISPPLMAQCGQNLSLFCNITHSLPQGTHVTMDWAHMDSNEVICKVNTSHPTNETHDYTCSLRGGVYLELTLLGIKPDNQGRYVCKLNSAVGAEDAVTSVTLDECYTGQSVTTTAEAHSCTFTGVYPDGQVHWFQGSNTLMGSTTMHVEPRGGLTICSTLEINSTSGHLPYNCSLWSPRAKRYLTSQLVTVPSRISDGPRNATKAHRAFWELGAILLASHFLMKLWA